jgi:D-3-phosphoglycerate dehydrogenase
MKKTVLVATEKPFKKEAVEGIKKVVEDAGYKFKLLEKYDNKEQLLNAVNNVDALIIRSDKVTKEVLDAATNLKIVVRAGAGFDNVDCAYAKEKGIVVMNTPGQNSNAVAELAFGMMLNLIRKGYTGKAGTELKGKSIGIHAYGHVGKNVARIAKGFGMSVYAHDPFIDDNTIKADGVTPLNSPEKLYETCNFVSLHLPKNEKTINFVNYDLMNKMPKNSALINTARAEVVCEDSLKKILSERDDWMYGSDVAPKCREELENKFSEQVFFTAKKMGAQTAEANINAGLAAANQIVNFFEKGDTTFQVNK